MAITFTCPRCEHKQQVADDLAGAEVMCRICHHVINTTTTAIQTRPAPAKKSPPAAATTPKRRPGRADSSSNLPWIVLGGSMLALVLLLCGVGGVLSLFCVGWTAPDKPLNKPKAPLAHLNDQANEPDKPPPPPLDPPAKPAADPQERVRNGDFEQGNKGFRTDYKLSPGNIRAEITYDIVTNPQNAHTDAAVFGDHTSGKGNMMLINGGNAPQQLVWGQTADVRPDAEYIFSLWVASWTPFSPAQLEVRINGQSIGRVAAPQNVGLWREFKVQWNAGAAKSAAIEIYDVNTAFSGNDFALDDISLRGPAPQK